MEDKVRIRFEIKTSDARKELEKFGVKFDKETHKVILDLEKLGEGFKKVGKRLSLFITAPLAGLGAMAVKTAGEFEKQKVAFETMLGSAEKAKALLQDMIKFSAKTPFQLPQIEELSAQLLSFGISARDVIDVMKRLGDVAMGDSEKLGRLTHAYGVLRARGVATLEQLNMFTEAGVPIMQKLAEQYKVTTNELFKMVSQGKVSFEDVNNALIKMTEEGGQFYKMTERQSQTFLGLWSTMKDNVKLLAQTFGDMLLPKLKKMLDGFTNFIQRLQDMSPAGKKAILIFSGIAMAIPPIILSIGTLISMFNKVKTAMSIVSGGLKLLSNPIGMVIAAIALLVTAGYLLIKHWNEVKDAMAKIWNWIKDKAVLIFTKVKNTIIKSLVAILEKVKGMAQVFGLTGAKIQNAIDKLNAKLVEHRGNWRDNAREITNVKITVENINPKLDNLKNQLGKVSDGQKEVAETTKKAGQEIKKIILPIKTYQSQLSRTGEYVSNFMQKTKDMTDVYQHFGVTAQNMNTIMQDSFMNAWEAIWDTTKSMEEKIKGAIKELFVMLLKAIGKQMAISAIAYTLSMEFGKAALALTLSAAAFAGASFINSLQQGGIVKMIKAQQGYGGGDVVPAMLEPGEMVIRKEVVKEQGAILNMINSGEPAPLHIQLHIGSKLIFDEISKASRDGKIIIDKRAIRV